MQIAGPPKALPFEIGEDNHVFEIRRFSPATLEILIFPSVSGNLTLCRPESLREFVHREAAEQSCGNWEANPNEPWQRSSNICLIFRIIIAFIVICVLLFIIVIIVFNVLPFSHLVPL